MGSPGGVFGTWPTMSSVFPGGAGATCTLTATGEALHRRLALDAPGFLSGQRRAQIYWPGPLYVPVVWAGLGSWRLTGGPVWLPRAALDFSLFCPRTGEWGRGSSWCFTSLGPQGVSKYLQRRTSLKNFQFIEDCCLCEI